MSTNSKAWIALVFICIAWGTTYLGIKFALGAMPPFLMAGVRQVLAGLLVFLMATTNKLPKDMSRANLLRQALIGFLLITVGNGLVSWAEAIIPSSVAALICAMMPIMSVLISVFVQRGEKLNALILLGMLLGFLGVVVNFRDSISDLSNTRYIIGIFATLVGTIGWASGSILGKNNSSKANPIFNSAVQITVGGIFLLIISPAVDDYSLINLADHVGLLSILYLIIVGSVLAYTAYMYALKHLPIGMVLTYAYINPLVAVLIGWWLANEPLNVYTAISFICITAGVFVVRKGYQIAKKEVVVKVE